MARLDLFIIVLATPLTFAYLRSATACTGTQVISSEAECQTAVAAINAAGATTATYTQDATSEWPQGCFFHVNGAYWQGVTSTGAPSPPITPDDGLQPYICRSGFTTTSCGDAAACTAACSGSTRITTYAACMEASVQQATDNTIWWNSWVRNTQCATGHLALVSADECLNNGLITSATTFTNRGGTATNIWTQGCIINGDTIYWAPEVQVTSGGSTPAANDGGNPYICRNENDPGTDWPQGCFVNNNQVWFQPNAQTGGSYPDGGMICTNGYGSVATGDPHIVFANGGRADFRGSHRASYAFVSSPGYQFAPYFQEADFWYSSPTGLKQLVHGTFMTKATWRVRTAKGREILAITDAMKRAEVAVMVLPGRASLTTSADTGVPEARLLSPWEKLTVDDITIETRMLSARVESAAWEIEVTSRPIYNLVAPLLNETHVHGHWEEGQRRLDISIRGAFPQPDAHGIVGQSYQDERVRNGRLDEYGIDEFGNNKTALTNSDSDGFLPPLTTSAQAEGAIEGVHTDYKVNGRWSTDFAFSRFERAARAVQPSSKRTAQTSDFDGQPGWVGTQRE